MLGPILAAVAALFHAIYSLSIKFGFQKRDGQQELPALAMTFWLNVGVAILSLFFLPLAKVSIAVMWLDVLPVGIAHFIGTNLLVLGLKHGQASVVGPLLGTKVFFAAIASVFIAKEALGGTIWIAVVIAVPVLALVSYTDGERLTLKSIFRVSSLYTIGSAFSFGMTDGFSRLAWLKHQDRIGVFLCVNIMVGLFSLLLLVKLKRREVVGHDRQTWLTLGWIVCINTAVMTVFFYALTLAKNIAVANIIFSSRTVLIIPLSLLADRILKKPMDAMTTKTFWIRLAGSLLLMTTIGLSIFSMR
jgi:drug/metabolite transporter (DMT)-like permease